MIIEGLEAMAYELRKCNLRSLNLYHSNIGKYGAAALARWLRFDVGLQFFLESLKCCKYTTVTESKRK